MKCFRQFVFLTLIIAVPVFSQSERDSSKTIKSENKKESQIGIPKSTNEPPARFDLLNQNIFIPLNLKIYEKAMISGYQKNRKFTKDELSSGLADDELISFEKNKLNTQKMLSDLYGEDLIDEKKIMESLGITKEQIIGILAVLRFFLNKQ